MLAHLVHQRRSLLPAPSASAIRYATLHQEAYGVIQVFPTTPIRGLSWLWTGP
jgi:hypothetical protein